MASAGFGPPGDPAAVDQPWGHRRVGEAWVPVPPTPAGDNPPSLSPAGRAAMTLQDWGRFVTLHLGAPTLVPVPEGTPRPLLPLDALPRLQTPVPGEEYVAGWGVARRPWSKGPVLTHSGSNTMWFCTCWLAPTEGFAVLAVTNAAGETAPTACDQVAAALIGLQRQRAAR
jgi:CubicO group peptidase (beta-lactamase class C family)